MSSSFYNHWWIVSKKKLENLVKFDNKIQQTTKEMKQRPEAYHIIGRLYARYAVLVRDLAQCFDQSCTIQRGFIMKKLIDAATIRLYQLKEELTNIILSEYHYIDGNLIELKVIPQEVEMLDPGLVCDRQPFIEDLWAAIKSGERIYTRPATPPEQIEEMEELPDTEKVRKASAPKFNPPQTVITPEEAERIRQHNILTDAIILIQSHERARQERLYHGQLETRHLLKKRAAYKQVTPDAPLEKQASAALVMQKIYRGHLQRKLLKRREVDRRILIGMYESSWKCKYEQNVFEKSYQERLALKNQRIKEYIEANLAEKTRVLRVIAPGLMEDIGDEIREWFEMWYREAQNFDVIPPEELGGSVLIVRGDTMTPKEWLIEQERRKNEDPKAKAAALAAEKKKKAEQKKAAKERKKKEKEQRKRDAELEKKMFSKGEYSYKIKPYNLGEEIKESLEEYRKIWNDRPLSENPHEKEYMDLISSEKCYEMQLEVRQKVDELMRLELVILNEALARDLGKKPGPPPKEKKKKGKKNKDPTANRTTEDLFQELVDNGIIHIYPKVNLKDFKGDLSYQNWERRTLDYDPPPTLGDVRKAVVVNCILPLGVETMVRPKSVLIVGLRQSGKHILANAVFNETRCVLFDISPPILAGKYVGKKALKMLVHLINKMSRMLQPSVIFIDGAEKPFYKKIPEEEVDQDPKKMGGCLFKEIVKPIKPADRVLVLGITNQPYAAANGLNKAFEKVIFIPRLDYNSAYLYWRELLMSYHTVDRNFNASELAKYCVSYPLPALRMAVESVLIPSRLIQLSYKPLNAHEILDALIKGPQPADEKEWKKMESWFFKLPLVKKRIYYCQLKEVEREAAAKAAAKKKGK